MRMLSLLCLLIAVPFFSSGQLNAGFTTDKPGDCAPATIRFSNTSTGVSGSANYLWDFGNGNTSALRDPSAVFSSPGTYTISLTVTSSGQTSRHTGTVTVYRAPVVSFTVADSNICIPFPAVFTSTSSAGDGYISNYLWDFGDGQTGSGSSPGMNYAYRQPQQATVSLTATNNFGCAATAVNRDIVTTHPELLVSFTASETMFCNAPGDVNFTNSSTGPGTITYRWDFGDGTSSNAAQPSHTYTREGLYTVTLTATSSIGCVVSSVRREYIRVGGFAATFDAPAKICQDEPVIFTNTSVPLPQQTEWYVDGSRVWTWDNYTFSTYFNTPGHHTVEIRTISGTCRASTTRTFNVLPAPRLAGFISEVQGLCGSPTDVRFRDTTAGAVAWKWFFDSWTATSSLRDPVHRYTWDGYHSAQLTVTDANGCSSTVTKAVEISRPLVGIHTDFSLPFNACDSLTLPFEYRTTEALTSVRWEFGDGTTSTETSPVHTFRKPGSYSPRLFYTTVNGCQGVADFITGIRVRERPKANFTGPQEICGNTTAFFNSMGTTGAVDSYIWDFGDNTGQNYISGTHQYQEEGVYTVRLVAYNYSCSDTMTRNAYVRVAGPFARISSFTNTCEGTRGTVSFTDGSRLAQGWSWDFGDGTGSTYTTALPEVSHTYTRTGLYKVVQTVSNGSCRVSDSVNVYVLVKKTAKLDLRVTAGCAGNSSVNFTISGLDPSPLLYYWHYNYTLYDESGRNLNGYIWYNGYNGQMPINGELRGLPAGTHRIRAIMDSYYFNCSDTSAYETIVIGGPVAVIAPVPDRLCFKDLVSFRDQSSATGNIPLKSIVWDFGDGTGTTTAPGAVVTHRYANPGTYQLRITVTDNNNCTSSQNTAVTIGGPKAAFLMTPGNTVQLNTTVGFQNYSNQTNAWNSSYQWTIGSLASPTDHSPNYTFPSAGSYEITLVARNNDFACADTVKQLLTVKDFRTGFNTDRSFIGDYGNCPPVLARFRNTSVNYTRLEWDFGDGQTLVDHTTPSHVYSQPGEYIVTLRVYGHNGLEETQYDTIRVRRPDAAISVSALEACLRTGLQLNATLPGGPGSYQFDFGNGFLQNSTDSFASHSFLEPGAYRPTLVVTDEAGCRTAVAGPLLTIHPDPVARINPAAGVVCKGAAATLTASGGTSYSWSPVTGLDNPSASTVQALPASATDYQVLVRDANGCEAKAGVKVEVAEPFVLTGTKETDLCRGSSIKLQVSGTSDIRWIGPTTGMDNPASTTPTVTPMDHVTYTAVGQDRFNCYADTFRIRLNVRPLPVVNAGADREAFYGMPVSLNGSGSSDVTRWRWSPGDFLSCTSCQSPVVIPYTDKQYVLQGTNGYGCIARDTVLVKASCAEANIHIPTGFTPNNDGKNDRFNILGYGISRVKTFRIFNRWGNVIVDRKNFLPGDANAGWDGRYQGIEAEAGVYVYMIELECDSGGIFVRKGTVTLIR